MLYGRSNDPSHRGLRADRRHAHCGTGRHRWLDRLAMPAALRLLRVFREPARHGGERSMAHRPGRKRRSRDATVSALDARSRNRVRDGRRRGSDHRLHGPARVASTDRPCRGGRARHRTDVRSAQPAVRLRQDRAVDHRQGSGGERRRGTRGGGVAGRRADHDTGASARSRVLSARGRARLLRSHVAPLLGRRAATDRCCRRRGRDRRLVARLVGSFDLQGCVEGRGRALPHHAQGPDPRAHWRARGRRHHVAPRVPRRRAELGLPVLLDPGRGARARTR